MPPGERVFLSCVLMSACSLAGCNLDNPGDVPPKATLYVENALGLSPHRDGEPARYLYVANSNFDLRYASGTLQAYDLDELDRELDMIERDGCVDHECRIEPAAVRKGRFRSCISRYSLPVSDPDRRHR